MKELRAQCVMEMATFIACIPQFITNTFIRPEITGSLDGKSKHCDWWSEGDDSDMHVYTAENN